MNGKVVTRMAPSPTGEYHIGHLRTVLYNWAWARKNNGKFIIRIEDTDRTRFKEGATERILADIKDYGFDWDEGPIYQSERLQIYNKYAKELIKNGHAYECFCSAERLTKMREEQQKKGLPVTKYDRHCLKLSKEEIKKNIENGASYVVRLKVPDNETISFEDVVFGKIEVKSADLDDQVLLKSDGFPTYQLAVVVDDHLMGVTHIMRGNDWLPSTPKHVLLYRAFGWEMPVHVHLPNLKEIGGSKKLSKRFGAVYAREFLEEGYLPEALCNLLMFLGWNPGGEKEIYSLGEFLKDFTLEKIHKTDLVAFDRKKLDWLNSQYLSNKSDNEIMQLLVKYAPRGADRELLRKISPLVKTRMKKLSEFMNICGYFFEEPEANKSMFSQECHKHFSESLQLNSLGDFKAELLGEKMKEIVSKNNFSAKDYFMDMRIAVSGSRVSLPLNESMEILGKSSVINRIKKAIE